MPYQQQRILDPIIPRQTISIGSLPSPNIFSLSLSKTCHRVQSENKKNPPPFLDSKVIWLKLSSSFKEKKKEKK